MMEKNGFQTGSMELRSDMIVDELRRLAPEFRINGGSFSHWLPHPRHVAPTERQRLRKMTERNATAKCLTDLVASIGLPAVEPGRLASGSRNWPAGYTGSVSHKGTMVAAAIVPSDRMRSIGVDLERHDAATVPMIPGLDAGKHPPATSDTLGRVGLLSVKEAAFKASHPILGLPLNFTDVEVSWLPSDPPCYRGVARARDIVLEVRCSTSVSSWIVSAALVRR